MEKVMEKSWNLVLKIVWEPCKQQLPLYFHCLCMECLVSLDNISCCIVVPQATCITFPHVLSLDLVHICKRW